MQVGRHTRPYTKGWRKETPRNKARAIIEALQQEYGLAFRTSISSKVTETDVRGMLEDAGVENPKTLYFGNLKSRNDFRGETVGLVLGCIDPGDERILDLLALCGRHALPNRDANGNRGYGREFDGPDADIAAEFLASVREQNLAQAVGRYARRPGTDAPGATVYVWSDALPDSLVDETVPGVVGRVTENKDRIAEFLRRQGTVTRRETEEACGTGRTHTYEVLNELVEQGLATVSEYTGPNNAHEYHSVPGVLRPSVNLGF